MKKRALLFLVIIGAFCLSGCKRIELDADVEEAYVEYAVNAVINHDKNNMLKMERVPLEKEEETEWISDDDGSNNNSSSGSQNNDSVITDMEYVSFEKALGMDALSVKVKGIKECPSYPESNGDELNFVVTASTGTRLAVIEMELTNISGDTVTLDTTKGYSFKGIFNGIVRTNALSAFDYSLYNSTHEIKAGETIKTALIYELNNERVAEVSKVIISVTRDGSTYNVNVK